MKAVLYALLLTIPGRATADAKHPGGLFQGTLGKTLKVTVLLKQEGESISGRYFYEKRGADIVLRGKLGKESTLELEEISGAGAVSASWSLASSPEGLSGTWIATKSKRKPLEVTLVRIGEDSPETAYEERKANRSVKKGPVLKASDGSFTYQLVYRAPEIGIPRLVDFPDAEIKQKINERLEALRKERGCDEDDGGWNTSTEVSLATREALSLHLQDSYFCGGAHPDGGDASVTFDLRTGEVVEFPQLFSDYAGQKRRILETVYAGVIDPKGSLDSDKCPDKMPLAEVMQHEQRYHLEPGFLVAVPEFPHVMAACAIEHKVSFEKLRPLLAKDGLLGRFLK